MTLKVVVRPSGRLLGYVLYQPHDRQAGERLRDLLDVTHRAANRNTRRRPSTELAHVRTTTR